MLYVTDIVDTGHGVSLDDLERLKVKVTNGAVTAIGMWGYTPVGLTGVLVLTISYCSSQCNQSTPRTCESVCRIQYNIDAACMLPCTAGAQTIPVPT